jgi:hypothetical protein
MFISAQDDTSKTSSVVSLWPFTYIAFVLFKPQFSVSADQVFQQALHFDKGISA